MSFNISTIVLNGARVSIILQNLRVNSFSFLHYLF
jgi:hypothetical protein